MGPLFRTQRRFSRWLSVRFAEYLIGRHCRPVGDSRRGSRHRAVDSLIFQEVRTIQNSTSYKEVLPLQLWGVAHGKCRARELYQYSIKIVTNIVKRKSHTLSVAYSDARVPFLWHHYRQYSTCTVIRSFNSYSLA